MRNYMALSIRRAAACAYFDPRLDASYQLFALKIASLLRYSRTNEGLIEYDHDILSELIGHTWNCFHLKLLNFCSRSVIKLQNAAEKRCIITLMSLAIVGIRDSAMRQI